MGLHEVDRDVVALGIVVVRVLGIHDLEDLILRIVLDEFLPVLDVNHMIRRRGQGGDEGDLAALRVVHQRAVEHGLRGLLVRQLIDEHFPRSWAASTSNVVTTMPRLRTCLRTGATALRSIAANSIASGFWVRKFCKVSTWRVTSAWSASAVPEDGDDVRDESEFLKPVGDEDDRDSAVAQAAYDLEQPLCLGGRQRRG